MAVPDLVGNPEDRFSHNEAHISVWGDPFGVSIESCWASNNAAFVDDSTPTGWERSEQFITTRFVKTDKNAVDQRE